MKFISRTKRSGHILFVGDESDVREVSRITLENAGYTVLSAKNGKEAVEIFSNQDANIRMIVPDLTMPEMGWRARFSPPARDWSSDSHPVVQWI